MAQSIMHQARRVAHARTARRATGHFASTIRVIVRRDKESNPKVIYGFDGSTALARMVRDEQHRNFQVPVTRRDRDRAGSKEVRVDRDQLKGKAQDVAGQMRERGGDAMNDEEMDQQGREQQAEGQAQGVRGKVEDKAGDAFDAAKDRVGR